MKPSHVIALDYRNMITCQEQSFITETVIDSSDVHFVRSLRLPTRVDKSVSTFLGHHNSASRCSIVGTRTDRCIVMFIENAIPNIPSTCDDGLSHCVMQSNYYTTELRTKKLPLSMQMMSVWLEKRERARSGWNISAGRQVCASSPVSMGVRCRPEVGTNVD